MECVGYVGGGDYLDVLYFSKKWFDHWNLVWYIWLMRSIISISTKSIDKLKKKKKYYCESN